MRYNYKNTTEWKRQNGLKSINFCIPVALLLELDSMRNVTYTTRSEIIRAGIRMYIREYKNRLADKERKALEAYSVRQQNQHREVSTGLLPDY